MNLAALFLLIALSPASQDRQFLQQAVASLRTQSDQAFAHYADSNLRLRWYAHKVIHDYARVESKLCDVGRSYGISLDPAADAAPAPRPFFANDALWLEGQIQRQRSAIARFERESVTTPDRRLRKHLRDVLPLLRQDLTLAQRIAAKLPQRAVT